ncbi:MAG: OmpA family protein [Bacteroidales bacterium]|nr:OmpA family protein [Bacteroidales bacterium]
MKKLILLLAVIMLMPAIAEAQKPRRGAKEVSPFIEGKQKVRKTDYDSIWKFTVFDAKKIYFCNFDYSTIPTIIEDRRPEWGNFTPVMNYLTTVSRSPLRICAVFAINPNIQDDALRERLIEEAKAEALESLQAYQAWAAEKGLKNKLQLSVAQVDYRYWQGTEYFTKEQTSDALIHVGLLLYFGTKKIDMFPSAAAGAKTFNDVKFFPNDATVVESYEPMMDSLATYLRQNERLEVLLRGYSDNTGTEAYNMGLSRQRAVEIKKKLIARGIPEYRIEIEAKGTADPIGDNNTYEGRIANNRVAIIIQ